jgi:hypothetical protein
MSKSRTTRPAACAAAFLALMVLAPNLVQARGIGGWQQAPHPYSIGRLHFEQRHLQLAPSALQARARRYRLTGGCGKRQPCPPPPICVSNPNDPRCGVHGSGGSSGGGYAGGGEGGSSPRIPCAGNEQRDSSGFCVRSKPNAQ